MITNKTVLTTQKVALGYQVMAVIAGLLFSFTTNAQDKQATLRNKKEWCLPKSNGQDQMPMHKHD